MAEEHIKMFLRVVERHRRMAGDFASDARDYEFTFAHSLGLGDGSSIQDGNDGVGENEKTDEEEAERSPPGSEYSVHDDDTDSASSTDSETPSSPSLSHATRSLPLLGHSPCPTASSPTPDSALSSAEEFPPNILRPTTPTVSKRTHLERATNTPHASPDKKRLREKVESATSHAMAALKSGSPSKVPALFQMSGWSKPKILTAEEKQDVFAAEAEERRDKAEEHAKQERLEQLAKDEKRKEGQNERQHCHRAHKRKAEDTKNPGGKKRKVNLKYWETASRSSIAEASRPAREITKKVKDKTRDPSGRKKKNPDRAAKYVNWTTPFSWSAIAAAQAKVGWGYTDIVRELRRVNYDFFQHLTPQTVNGWIEKVGGFSQWKASILECTAKGKIPGHNKGGRRGILTAHPEIIKEIVSQLADLRAAGAPVSLASVRCIIIAIITERAPELFDHCFKDGSTFRVSDSFCKKFIGKTLVWSMRKGTKAAQKLPPDAEDQCEDVFLRRAWTIKEHRIPAALVVNADQTGVVYLPGSRMTYAPRGSKQVGLIGNEEKRTFMALLAVSAAGEALPIQCVYEGKTSRSIPSKSATSRQECDDAKFRFWVDDVLVPYLNAQRERLSLPLSQKALVIIDVWSVHRSREFQDWLRKNHPNILVDFVPGGCTGGIPFMARRHLLEQRRKREKLDLDTGLPVLQDASVGWIWQGYKAIQNKELILKAWATCSIRSGLNLSFDCMTSFDTKERLINLRNDNPKLWNDLQTKSTRDYCPGDDEEVAEDLEPYEDEEMGADNSEIPTREVVQHVVTKKTGDKQ
ncbi:hypothetical protein B0H13DRAFT_2381017 [Mycena leptocephala]|nr:hypothetical protein B0H13DRAFT_2381017 [Mycena leptocephala]